MFNKQNKFSIRKLSVGVASVMISSLMLGVSFEANAETEVGSFKEYNESDYFGDDFVDNGNVTETYVASKVENFKEPDGIQVGDLTFRETDLHEFNVFDTSFDDFVLNLKGSLLEKSVSTREKSSETVKQSSTAETGFYLFVETGSIGSDIDLNPSVVMEVARALDVDYSKRHSDAFTEWNPEYEYYYSKLPFEYYGAHFVEDERRRNGELANSGTGKKWYHKFFEEPYKFFEDDHNYSTPYGSASVQVAMPVADMNYNSFASAVQIGSNTYLTAAHLFLDKHGSIDYFEGNEFYILHRRSGTFHMVNDGKRIVEEEKQKGNVITVPMKLDPRPGESGISFFNFAGYDGVSPTDIAIITVAEPIEISQGRNQIPRLLGENKKLKVGDYVTWSGYPSYDITETIGNGEYLGGRKTVRQKIAFTSNRGQPMYMTYSKSAGGASGSGMWDDEGKVRGVLNGSLLLYKDYPEDFPDKNHGTTTMHAVIEGKAHEWVTGLLNKHDYQNKWYEKAGKRYYFDEERKLVRGTTRVIEGKLERFNDDGVWVETMPPVIRHEEDDVDFPRQTENDPNIKQGETRIKQRGVKGRKRITYTNGVKTGETEITPPTPEITLVGTGIETVEEVDVDFNIVEQPDVNIKSGERRTERPGQKGRKRVTKLNGRATNETVLRDPVDEIVKVGTGVEVIEEEEIPFNTIREDDINIKKGETRTERQGKKGRKRVTKFNGYVVKEDILENSVDELIKIGTGIETVEEVDIPFKTVRENDINIKQGETRTERQGKKGRKRVTKFNGTVTNETVLENAVDELIKVGIGVETVEEVEIPFKTIREDDVNLKTGETRTDRQGKKGRKRVTKFNGAITKEDVLENAVDELIKVGTGIELVNEVDIDFKTIEEDDINIKKGETKVITQGRKGRKRVTTFNGVVTKEDILVQPENRLVKIGTGIETVEELDIDFTISEENDINIKQGERKIERKGKKGRKRVTKFNGVVTKEDILVNPENELVKVGIGVETVDEVEIGFKVAEEQDVTLKQGERKVVRKGETGRKRVTKFNGAVVKEDVLKPAVDELVKVGTGVETTEDVEVDFSVEEEDDINIKQGERKVVRKGEKGLKRVTKFNGEIVKEVEVRPAINELVKVGTGIETVETVDVPFKVIEELDNSIPKGERKVIRKGTKGTKQVTTFNGKVVKEVELTLAVDELVKVGDQVTTYDEVDIPFDEERIDDDTIPMGEERVEREGVMGIKRITYTNGIQTNEETIKNPINKLIRVGKQVTEYEEVEIPFETEVVKDPDLPLGKRVTKQASSNGKKRIKKVNGVVVGEEVLIAVVNEVVHEGIKPISESKEPIGNDNIDTKPMDTKPKVDNKDKGNVSKPKPNNNSETKIPNNDKNSQNSKDEKPLPNNEKLPAGDNKKSTGNDKETGLSEKENSELNTVVTKTTVTSKEVQSKNELPDTGEYDLFIPAVMSMLVGLGIIIPTNYGSKKELG